ncbi:(R)-mandelonitrile lyase-like protein [Tanacetum coccineum]
MSRAYPQAAIVSKEQLVPSDNRLKIAKNNQRIASNSNITDSFLRLVASILKHHKLYKPISLTTTVPMPPKVHNKPFTKPLKENELLAFIKTLDMHSEEQDLFLSKRINTVDSEFKFGMELPFTMINVVIKQSAGYKVYQSKKKKSEEDNSQEESEEQHVSTVRRGRGKGYMCLVEEAFAAEKGKKLKGIATEDPAVQSLLDLRKGSKESRLENTDKDDVEDYDMDIYDDDSDNGDDDAIGFRDYTLLLNEKLKNELTNLFNRPVFIDAQTTFVVANPEGNHEITSFLSGTSEVPFRYKCRCSTTGFVLQEHFEDTTDHQISSPPETTIHNLVTNPQQSSIQAKAKKLVIKARHTKLNFKKAVEKKFKEYDQKMETISTINVPGAIEEFVQAKVLTEMKKLLSTHVPKVVATFVKPHLNNTMHEIIKNNQNILFTTPSLTTTNDLSEMELKIKMPHDDQDPPNDREGEKRSKRRKDARESSSKSSKKDKAPMDSVQDDIPADKPQDKGEELIQKHLNTKWFSKKYGSVDAAKRKSNWFDMLLKSNIDQDKDYILGLSTVIVAKKFKELIKNELTIADIEGAGLEMLKRQYKNYVELEYHVDQLKAAMTEKAQWSNGDSDLTKPRSFKNRCLKVQNPIVASTTTTSTTLWIEDMISDRWSKEVHLYHVDALNGIHQWDDMRKDFFKAEMGNMSTHKVKRIDNKEYEFSYADLSRLNLNDIEDMYLLKVHGKLHHLKLEFEIDFINALLLCIRRVMIKNRTEDTQLGVESYQRTLNLTKPKFYFSGINHKIPYTTTETKKGVVFLNKCDVKSLMQREDVHKFCDGTIFNVQDNLLKMLNENKLGRGNVKLEGREWTKNDIKKSELDFSFGSIITGVAATGIVYHDSKGRHQEIHVRINGEVIICAGAIGSPQLLLVSGVGHGSYLASMNISVIHQHPYVGQFMTDNPRNQISLLVPFPLDDAGIRVVGITENGVYIESVSGVTPFDSPNNFMFFPDTSPPLNLSVISIVSKFMRPLSRGFLSLISPNDITVTPNIRFNYYSDSQDLVQCGNMVRTIGKMLRIQAMEPYKFSDGDGGKHFKFVGLSLPENPTNEEAVETFLS